MIFISNCKDIFEYMNTVIFNGVECRLEKVGNVELRRECGEDFSTSHFMINLERYFPIILPVNKEDGFHWRKPVYYEEELK